MNSADDAMLDISSVTKSAPDSEKSTSACTPNAGEENTVELRNALLDLWNSCVQEKSKYKCRSRREHAIADKNRKIAQIEAGEERVKFIEAYLEKMRVYAEKLAAGESVAEDEPDDAIKELQLQEQNLKQKVDKAGQKVKPSISTRKVKRGVKPKAAPKEDYQVPSSLIQSLEVIGNLIRRLPHHAARDTMVLLEVMTFQVRDCRSQGVGKGVRPHSWFLFEWLADKCPKTAGELLSLYPKYGYWKDLSELMILLEKHDEGGSWVIIKSTTIRHLLRERVVELYAKQLVEDYGKLQRYLQKKEASDGKVKKPNLTLAGKWAPRKHKHFDRACHSAKLIALKIYSIQYPEEYAKYAEAVDKEQELPLYIKIKTYYRRMIVALNSFLETIETKLQKGTYSTINFDHVPGKALQRYKKAIMNKDLKEQDAARWPEDQDRKDCAEKFGAFIAEKTKNKNEKKSAVKGHSVTLPSLVAEATKVLDETEKSMLALQFEDHKKILQKAIDDGTADFDHGLVVADVSGSMCGTPMDLSVGMALMISSLAKGPWHGKFITFSESPEFIQIDEELSFVDAVTFVRSAPWGANTDFVKVFEMILEIAVAEKLPASMLPKWILVVSDMQFDSADKDDFRGYKCHHQILKEKFAKAGTDGVGEPYEMPRMIYWNARALVAANPVDADEVGTVMVSGYSPAILKSFLSSASFDNVVTPFQSMKDVLDHEFYDDVRKVLGRVKEAPYFVDYVAPTPAALAEKQD